MTAVVLTIFAVANSGRAGVRENELKRKEALHERWRDEELRDKAVADCINCLSNEGWKHVSQARLMHISGQPWCLFMASDNGLLIRITQYSWSGALKIEEPIFLSPRQVISISTAKPKVKRTKINTTPVAVTETKGRSPVARGLVGGAVLGPVGLLLGAASGLKETSETHIEHVQTKEEYLVDGDPQLIIGTSNFDTPVFKLKFSPASLADTWMSGYAPCRQALQDKRVGDAVLFP